MSFQGALVNAARHLLDRTGIAKNPRNHLLQRLPKAAICAEIGVWKGDFSARILKATSPAKLHLVDPWIFQPEFAERMFGGAVAKNQEDMDRIFENVARRFKRFPNVVLNRGKSEDVLSQFPDAYFDWVYIDGNHYYEYVLKDLNICFSKVKPGGVIAGDDYTWSAKDGFPVKRAVNDFTNDKGLVERTVVIDSQFIIQL